MGHQRTKKIEWIVIHHSAANDYYSDPAALKDERARRNEGYNFIIDDDQALTDPKKANDHAFTAVQDAPDSEISNGVYGVNSVAWNICVDGNFETQKPTEDEIFGLVQVIAAKAKAWGWRKKQVDHIISHQYAGMHVSAEYYVTACPGRNLIARIPEIRDRVKAYLPD